MSSASTASEKPQRSLFDKAINAVAVLILIGAAINEFAHLYRVPQTIAATSHLYERHTSWSSTFPFVGSYFLMKPADFDPKRSYPLVVALHGISNRIYAAEALASSAFRKAYPVFVMVPVAPARAFWATPENPSYQMQRNIPYPDHLPQVMTGIEAIAATYPIDRSRVYIVGHSMGASGVMGALERYSDQFAAGIASSGSWDHKETRDINDPVLIVHGNADKFVPYKHSHELAAHLKARGLPVKFYPLRGQGHAIGPFVYSRAAVWNWLFSITNNKVSD